MNLVAPPYDVISESEREELAAKSEYNAVWLTLPEGSSEDRSKFVKYGRSATRLATWRRDGILVADDLPSLYRYTQTFLDPTEQRQRSRTCMICLLKTEPYEKGVVLPHEQTFPKHKEDRLRLLEATRSHLECIFGLYLDEDKRVEGSLESAEWLPVLRLTTTDEIQHELEVCIAEDSISQIVEAMRDERIWIADGHHRYETARAFRESLGKKEGEIAEDYILIGLTSMKDPGLALLPTHRIVNGFPINRNEAIVKLQTYFNVRTMANNMLPDAVRSLDSEDTRAFGIVLPGETGILATLDRPQQALEWIEREGTERLKLLDVTILHEVIFAKALGITNQDSIQYTRDANEAISIVEASNDKLAAIMNPPSVDDMRRIAEAGEKMPQKSTYYYPKLLTGLVFWSMSDFKTE